MTKRSTQADDVDRAHRLLCAVARGGNSRPENIARLAGICAAAAAHVDDEILDLLVAMAEGGALRHDNISGAIDAARNAVLALRNPRREPRPAGLGDGGGT